jgi:hypothetical protein
MCAATGETRRDSHAARARARPYSPPPRPRSPTANAPAPSPALRKSVVLSLLFRAAAAALLLRARACAAGSYRARTSDANARAGEHTLGRPSPGEPSGFLVVAGRAEGVRAGPWLCLLRDCALRSRASLAAAHLTLSPSLSLTLLPFPPALSPTAAASHEAQYGPGSGYVYHDTSSAAGYRPAAGETATCLSCGAVVSAFSASKANHLEKCGGERQPYGKQWRKNA